MNASEQIKVVHLVSRSLNSSNLELFVSSPGLAVGNSDFYLPLTTVCSEWCNNSAKPDHQSYLNAHGGNNASSFSSLFFFLGASPAKPS